MQVHNSTMHIEFYSVLNQSNKDSNDPCPVFECTYPQTESFQWSDAVVCPQLRIACHQAEHEDCLFSIPG